MAAPSKKRVAYEQENKDLVEDEEGDDCENMSEDASSGEEDEEMIDEVVHVDFEAREAEDTDFHGVRKLLQQLFLKAHVNVSELANIIIAQNYVGSVLKQVHDMEDSGSEGDDDDTMEVYGVMSCINITEKKDEQCVGDIRTMLMDQCKKCAVDKSALLQSRLSSDGKQLGFLVSERFINIPPQMAAPSYDSLRTDMKNAASRKMKYKFDELLMISKIYKSEMPCGKKKKKGPVNDAVSFINPEEEFFFQEASFSFDYSVADEQDSMGEDEDDQLLPWRRVMFVPAGKLDMISEKIRQTFS